MKGFSIISDGTKYGTEIKIGDVVLDCVTKVELEPIEPGEGDRLQVKLTVFVDHLELVNTDFGVVCENPVIQELIEQLVIQHKLLKAE
jgi:hypothetical protein